MIHIYTDMQEQFCVVMPKPFAGMQRFLEKIKFFVSNKYWLKINYSGEDIPQSKPLSKVC